MGKFSELGNQLYTGEKSIDFVGKRKIWYAIAIVLMIFSIAMPFVKGVNLGIDFRGGSEFMVSKPADVSEGLAVEAVQSVVPGMAPRVSIINGDTVRVQTDDLEPALVNEIRAALMESYQVGEGSITSSYIGPTWGADVTNKALLGIVVFILLASLAITLYFRTWKLALAAIIALFHDLILTAGLYVLIGFEITPAAVIGFLTILGYSLYDKVVVFDKVRENTASLTEDSSRSFSSLVNLAINQTLVRSINTSVTSVLPVGSILFIGSTLLGASTLRDISLTLFLGVLAGAYSSIFLAAPLYAHLRENEKFKPKREPADFETSA